MRKPVLTRNIILRLMQSDKDIYKMKKPDPSPMLFRLLFVSGFIMFSAGLFSQEAGTCAEKLKNAQSFFEKGQVEEVPGLLKDCLKSGFKKEEELTAYKLLIQTFLLNDNLKLADSTMYEFLKKNPEYQLSPTDHSSFVYLFNNFKVKPVLQLTIHAGINVPFLTFVTPNLTSGENVKSSFSSNVSNLFFSLESKFKIGEKTEAGLEVGFSKLKFSNTVNQGFAVLNYTESQSRLEIPLSLTYDFASFGKLTAYSRTGLGAALNLGVTATDSYNPTDNNNPNRRTGESLARKDSRVSVDFYAQVGAGLKYKISRGFFLAEIRSNFGIKEQNVQSGKTVSTTEFFYFWRDPNFRLNALNINIGYTYIFYKPTKRGE
jgi:hypothetical protein